jgi:hypothetical protein
MALAVLNHPCSQMLHQFRRAMKPATQPQTNPPFPFKISFAGLIAISFAVGLLAALVIPVTVH